MIEPHSDAHDLSYGNTMEKQAEHPSIAVDEYGSIIGVDTRALDWDQQYKILSGTVIPRPIALVTSDGPAGLNAAPFSFFNAVALGPPMVMFSIGPTMFEKRGAEKDTLKNIRATREFVVHLVDDGNREKMNLCSPEYATSVNEMELAGFRTAASVRVRPPRIVDCPVQYECVVTDILELGKTPYFMVVGEVVYSHFHTGIVSQRFHVDMLKLDPIGRLANPGMYARITDHFQMLPPQTSASDRPK